MMKNDTYTAVLAVRMMRGAVSLALIMILALLVSSPVVAGGKGSMEIGLSSHYCVAFQDADHFEPSIDYGLIFHYWLNDTTTILGGFEQMRFTVPLEVDGSDDDLVFQTGLLYAGVRYRPEIDFFMKPYVGAGIGYQTWNTDTLPSGYDRRDGGSMIYFGDGGLDYEFARVVTLSFNVRYYHLGISDRIESELFTTTTGDYLVDYDPFRSVSLGTAGIELTWRFR